METEAQGTSAQRKKVIYAEPDRPIRAIVGTIKEDDQFFRVRNADGEMVINRSCVLLVKNAAAP